MLVLVSTLHILPFNINLPLNTVENGATHLSQVKSTSYFFISGGEFVVILVVASTSS